ncbi:MAG: 4Fe-4S binding protein [Candidatus Lokiarchaeota archaeon]|nr:4Fe-4S binding protein [Candidatus Lokiarchaeota archaeon]
MTTQNTELGTYFIKMLDDIDDLLKVDEVLKKDLKDLKISIQWFVNGIKGYQIFDNGKYTHRFGEEIENADLTIKFADEEIALRFLKGNLERHTYVYYRRKFKLYSIEKEEKIEKDSKSVTIRHRRLFLTAYFTKSIFYHPSFLTRFPLFREIATRHSEPENSFGSYIPINASLGKFENQLMPEKMLEHFIKKAKHFYVQNACGCRVFHDCQDHDKKFACMYIGDDVPTIKLPPSMGHSITQEEALTYAKDAIKNGLVPTFGRAPGETNAIGAVDTGHIMSICYCCPCCCLNGKIAKYATREIQMFTRMEGLTVEVDPSICNGCGTCLDVCVFVGRDVINGKAVIDQERCLGCGRCEQVCPNDAITIKIDDPKRVVEHIQRLEESVDVS